MSFDTLDYLYFLIAAAWLAALAGAFIAIASHRVLERRLPPARLSSAGGRLMLHSLTALTSLVPAAAFALGVAIVWFALTRDFFALVRIGYYQIAAVPVMLGIYLLIGSFRRGPAARTPAPIVVALLLMMPAPICAYASFIAPYQLIVERAEVPMPRMTAGPTPIKVAVIADLQTAKITDYERRAIDLALAEKPDLILMPGDFFQCSWRQWKAGEVAFREEMQRLACRFGTFAVLGDVDDLDDMTQLLHGTPVRLLHNEVATLNINGQRIAIGGVELQPGTRASDATISELADTGCDVRILLAHRPDLVFRIPDIAAIDLVVAGHTHGGQIVIPGFGPPITLSHVPREAAAGGLHLVNRQCLYVSRGVGCERGSAPPMRLFCPPELTVLTLTAAASTTSRPDAGLLDPDLHRR